MDSNGKEMEAAKIIHNNEPDFETEDEAIIDEDAPPDEMSGDPASGDKANPRFGTPIGHSLYNDIPFDVPKAPNTEVKPESEESDDDG